jgi:hypothetical protein
LLLVFLGVYILNKGKYFVLFFKQLKIKKRVKQKENMELNKKKKEKD